MNTKWIFPVLAAGMINVASASDHDHDSDNYGSHSHRHAYPAQAQIRQWVEQGEILSLETILQRHNLPGELLDVEVEWEDDVLVYELKWIDDYRQRHKTWINASSGELLGDKVKDHD